MRTSPVENVFVVGLDDFNREALERVEGVREGRVAIHPLLAHEEVRVDHEVDFEALLARARQRLDGAPVKPNAIVGYWDFPTSFLAPILAKERGLRAPSVEAVARCEHKYLSRMCQRDLVPDHIPDFASVDPFSTRDLPLNPPFWIKPVKAWSSQLGFRIEGRDDFEAALAEIRDSIELFAKPVDQALAHADLPRAVRAVTGRHCIAEGIVGGKQCTVEGYAQGGAVVPYGIIDSIRHTNGSTFSRYQYPTHLRDDVQARVCAMAQRVIAGLDYRDGLFNVEFFYDEGRDRIWLLEINARISQSHAFLFADVDGFPNHQEAVDVALGREPPPRKGEGPFGCAAKLFYRTFRDDAVVSSVPDDDALRELEAMFEGVHLETPLEEGMRLSDLADQDSYSFELARLHIGGADEGELLQKYQECVDRLQIGLDEAPPSSLTPQSVEQLAATVSFAGTPSSSRGADSNL